MKIIRLILIFYRLYAFLSFIINIACVSIISTWGIRGITAVFWFKIFTLGLTYYYINNNKKEEFFYYKNLGLSKKNLWISTFTIDLSLFITIIVLTLKFT